MPQVALEQATIDYRVLGPEDSSHPPVLFVHGILVDNRLWIEVAERLARQGFRCFLPNWPLGSHTIPVNDGADLSPHGVATMIHDFIASLGLSDVTLVGNDTGGGLCQLLIDAYPDDVGRVVLTNCDAFDKFPPFPFTMVFAMLRGPKSIKTLFATMRIKALRHSPLGYGLLVKPDPALTASWLAPCRNDTRICRDLATLLRHVARTDLHSHIVLVPVVTVYLLWIHWSRLPRAYRSSLGWALIPLLAGLIGLFNSFRMMRLPDPKPSRSGETVLA